MSGGPGASGGPGDPGQAATLGLAGTPADLDGAVTTVVAAFAARLRELGVPVSLAEVTDAVAALACTGLAARDRVRSALRLTMIKNSRDLPLYEAAFDLAFPASGPRQPPGSPGRPPAAGLPGQPGQPGQPAEPGGGAPARPDLLASLLAALRSGSAAGLVELAAEAVTAFGGLTSGPGPGAVRYHHYRVLRQLDVSALLQRSMQLDRIAGLSPLERQVAAVAAAERLEEFRALLGAELRRRLAETQGLAASLAQLRDATLDTEFLRAGTAELAAMRDAVRPLARAIAARAGRRTRLRSTGRLDMRRTLRRSLSSGGVPADPVLRRRHRSRPHLLVLCDVSGSVAEFAKFTLSLLHALHAELPRLRSFVFVDGPHEITDLVEASPGVIDTRVLLSRPGVVRDDGHSDYGAMFGRFLREYGRGLPAETTLIICGDARSNYRPPRPELLAGLAGRLRRVYWLNPEPAAQWDSKDSVMSGYARHCTDVSEVRTLRQLSAWVEKLL